MGWNSSTRAVIVLCFVNAFWMDLCNQFGGPLVRRLSDRVILLQQTGKIRGVLVEFPSNQHGLRSVERYTGIQFGTLRGAMGSMLHFMPPSSAYMPIWGNKVREFTNFSPVCPQTNDQFYDSLRGKYRERFKQINDQLKIQNEDCLYLNIWCPISGT